MEVDGYVPQDFDGAAGAVFGEVKLWRCSDCPREFGHHTCLANVTPDNAFVKKLTPDMEKALHEASGKGFENKALTKPICRSVCAFCLQDAHGEQYTDTVKTPEGEVSTVRQSFRNKAKASKGFFRGKGKEAKIMEIFDEKAIRQAKAEDGPPVSAAAIHAALLESDSIFRAALDWITELSVFTYFYYGCYFLRALRVGVLQLVAHGDAEGRRDP